MRRQAFYSLPSEHWQLLAKPPFSILDSFSKLDDLIDSNSKLAEAIFVTGFRGFLAPTLDPDWVASIVPETHAHDQYEVYSILMDHLKAQATQNDMDKARGCVHQFYREWSADGALERSKCFDPVVKVLDEEFLRRYEKSTSLKRSTLRVLVPGAGLGRLVFDICRAGYSVEGNEISYHELLASSLALNHTKMVGEYSIAPFALNCSNHISRADQFRTYQIPDVHPGTELSTASEDNQLPASERMSISTGDFCVVYIQPENRETFDAVATVFFIDTAPNLIKYIEAVRNCLKPGGIWINLGPLLWHHGPSPQGAGWENGGMADDTDTGIADPGSVELADEEVVALVQHFGFGLERHETHACETGYISNTRSMLRSIYRPSFWIARKK
jgi:SAM-dependent methyltransferase